LQSHGHGLGDNLRDNVNEADGAKVRDRISPLLLGQQSNVGSIDDVQVVDGKLGESVNDLHKVVFDYGPASTEEFKGESIGARSFVRREGQNGLMDLHLREGETQRDKVLNGRIQDLPIKIQRSRWRGTQDPGEVLINDLRLVRVRRSPTLISL
jgi:hypothetical protein